MRTLRCEQPRLRKTYSDRMGIRFSRPVKVTFVLSRALCLAGLRLLTPVDTRNDRAGEGDCKQREDREGQSKDDHDISLFLRWHAGNQRSPFVFKELAGPKAPLVGTKIDKCRRRTTFFHATVFW